MYSQSYIYALSEDSSAKISMAYTGSRNRCFNDLLTKYQPLIAGKNTVLRKYAG